MTLPPTIAIGLAPHLISAATIPNGELVRALTEPLADGRDEVIYLVCSHPRVALGPQQGDGRYPVYMAAGALGGGMRWTNSWWACLSVPPDVTSSRVYWAIIDPALQEVERLPDIDIDLSDPDGPSAQNRTDLLGWIYDRHLELVDPPEEWRGAVDGGQIDLRLEYIGSSHDVALRRAAGAHHKVPAILGRLLLYEPHRLLYPLVCELIFAFIEDSPSMLSLQQAEAAYALPRRLLISAAEEALIAAAGAPYNKRNTVVRRFPESKSGEALAQLGAREVLLTFYGLPPRVRVTGTASGWEHDDPAIRFTLQGP